MRVGKTHQEIDPVVLPTVCVHPVLSPAETGIRTQLILATVVK